MKLILIAVAALTLGATIGATHNAGASVASSISAGGTTCRTLSSGSIGCKTKTGVFCSMARNGSASCLPSWTKGGYAVVFNRTAAGVFENRDPDNVIWFGRHTEMP
jgi:hypothetical protein